MEQVLVTLFGQHFSCLELQLCWNVRNRYSEEASQAKYEMLKIKNDNGCNSNML